MAAARARARGGGPVVHVPQRRSPPSLAAKTTPQQVHRGLATHSISLAHCGQMAWAASSPTPAPQNRQRRGRKNSRRFSPKRLSQMVGLAAGKRRPPPFSDDPLFGALKKLPWLGLRARAPRPPRFKKG